MSFLSKHSNECASAELDLFAVPPTQTGIEYAKIVEHSPTTKSSSGPFEFKICGTDSNYIDLSQTYLYVKAELVNADNEQPFTTFPAVAPANLFLNTMFQEVEISLNGEGIAQSGKGYPYRAYIETLLNYGRDAKKSHLQSALFHKDDSNKFDLFETDVNKNHNTGFVKRRALANKGVFVLYGRLHADIFFQEKYMLDNVAIVIKLSMSPEKFCLIGPDDCKAKLKIHEIKLHTRYCKISNSVYLAHALALEKATAKYPIKRATIKTFTVNKGIGSVEETLILSGKIPNRIVLGFLDDVTFNGKFTNNCFNFKNFGLNEIAVTANGLHAPNSPLKIDFDTNQYTRAYHSLFSGLDRAPLDCGNDISMDEYPFGYTLFAFDLSPDMCQGEHLNILRSGCLVVSASFGKPTTSNLICVAYMEFDNLIEICKSRTVLKDFLTIV
jgi:hypothetical protein